MSTSSPLRSLLSLVWHRRGLMLLAALLFVGMGEAWMRVPGRVHRLEYAPDAVFGSRLAPDQRGFIWLSRLSEPSAPITLNGAGWRGPEIDWDRRVVVTVGDSDGLGVGVSDAEVWTARLAASLGDGFQVQNACHPGDGPQLHALALRRALERGRPALALVRVSMQDHKFVPVDEPLLAAGREAAERRRRLRTITRFLPFLWSKARAQEPAIVAAARPAWLRESRAPGSIDRPLRADGEAMWRRNAAWWQEAARLGRDANVPVVFVVYDPVGAASSAVLGERIAALTKSDPTNHALVLGPGAFGLDALPDPESRQRELRARLSLRRDPHANGEQHRLFAAATLAGLRGLGLVPDAPR